MVVDEDEWMGGVGSPKKRKKKESVTTGTAKKIDVAPKFGADEVGYFFSAYIQYIRKRRLEKSSLSFLRILISFLLYPRHVPHLPWMRLCCMCPDYRFSNDTSFQELPETFYSGSSRVQLFLNAIEFLGESLSEPSLIDEVVIFFCCELTLKYMSNLQYYNEADVKTVALTTYASDITNVDIEDSEGRTTTKSAKPAQKKKKSSVINLYEFEDRGAD